MIRTIFACANDVIFYGKDGKLAGPDRETVEVSMLALHLLQSCLNGSWPDPKWAKKLTADGRRGLNALFWTNVNPYGKFRLDLDSRLDLNLTA